MRTTTSLKSVTTDRSHHETAARATFEACHHRVRQHCTCSVSGGREQGWLLFGVAGRLAGQA